MATGVPQASATVAAGSPAADPTIDHKAIVIGYTSTGEGLSPFHRTSAALVAERGVGDVVDTGIGVIEQLAPGTGAGIRYPVAVCSVPASVPGSYGALDVSGMAARDLAELIGELTDQMHAAAAELQFEVAARLRDEVSELKKELRAMQAAGHA